MQNARERCEMKNTNTTFVGNAEANGPLTIHRRK
jgi:hypothetical protein